MHTLQDAINFHKEQLKHHSDIAQLHRRVLDVLQPEATSFLNKWRKLYFTNHAVSSWEGSTYQLYQSFLEFNLECLPVETLGQCLLNAGVSFRLNEGTPTRIWKINR